jgi:hypothetical protein
MTDEKFLEKAHEHIDYDRLLKYQPSAEELDKAILRIRDGKGVSETYYEYRFTVEKESLSNDNEHLSDLLRDIQALFDKYKDKGIRGGDWDSKGGSTPAALDIVEDILRDNPQ